MCFLMNFAKFLRTLFLIEHLRVAASVLWLVTSFKDNKNIINITLVKCGSNQLIHASINSFINRTIGKLPMDNTVYFRQQIKTSI